MGSSTENSARQKIVRIMASHQNLFTHPTQQQQQQQQQWMAQQYRQQAANAASMNNLMAEHARQWDSVMSVSDSHSQRSLAPNSHTMSMPSAQFQHGSSSNLTTVSAPTPNADQYAAWQRQYQSQQNAYHSAMNMQQAQAQAQAQAQRYQMQQQQQQQQHQMQQYHLQQQQQQQQQMQMQMQMNSQQQQQQRNGGHFGSSGHLPVSANDTQTETETETDHSAFVPPPPQANAEIEKFVKWQAKRKGIQEQQTIEMEVARRQDKAREARETEERIQKANSFKVPIEAESRTDRLDSDIDYALMHDAEHDKGCCCLLM